MIERMLILGLVGPSAVGKGYCKDVIKVTYPESFCEPVIITTRPRRLTDGVDRLAGVPLIEFNLMIQRGVVLFAHQPFGIGSDWYGFSRDSLDGNHNLLAEIHVDNVVAFKDRFGEQIKLIALIAESEYLESNIRNRGTESEVAIKARLDAAKDEVVKIKRLEDKGLIDYVIEVDDANRGDLAQIMIELTRKILE